jgi:hypothetical protein
MNKGTYLIIVGIVVAAVFISIVLYTMLANHQPAISGLAFGPQAVRPLGSCQIVCNAAAPRDDKLTYNWSASGGTITGEGAAVTWTAPNSVGSYNVTVTVTYSRGGGVTDFVTIPVSANRPPNITNLAANAAWTTPRGSLQVTCAAMDPDGDELSYEWTTTGGDISGTDLAQNWTAPQEVGAYNVTVVVRDSYGGEDRRKITLCVDRGTPPNIENLIVTAQEPRYLKASSTAGCNYDVWVNRGYYIECIASNTSDKLLYEWSCDDGEISSQGSSITWTSPNRRSVEVTVTVIVSDAAGNGAGKSIIFWIPSCSCSFG